MDRHTVWKFDLPFIERRVDRLACSMPKGARMLHVAMQHGWLRCWCLVDSGAPRVTRRFLLVGTGDSAPPVGYLGTFQEGNFVGHVFDLGEQP